MFIPVDPQLHKLNTSKAYMFTKPYMLLYRPIVNYFLSVHSSY